MTRRMSSSIKIFTAFLVVASFLFFANQTPITQAQVGDAIAVRVLPNANHYSPLTWYKKQGYTGNPVPMKVDGYEAIRDGRTVYVNVANLVRGRGHGAIDTLWTNIYLISYNQEATPETLAIFDKILVKWRFNSNLITTDKCFDQASSTTCLSDADCTGGGYCASQKARLVRDIKRLGDIVDLREKIEEYGGKNKPKKYPVLSAGTYLPGVSISTWPSWNTELANALGIAPVDPINKLGKCNPDDTVNKSYDPVTCWNDSSKSFAGAINVLGVDLPSNSRALAYSSFDNGASYTACAYMESGNLVGKNYGACDGSVNYNQKPTVDCGSLLAIAGQPFEGYIGAKDVDDTDVVLTITSAPSFSVGNGPTPASKRIYSSSAPTPNSVGYAISGDAKDAHGNTTPFSCTITTQVKAFIVYPVASQKVLVGKKIVFPVYVNNSDGNYGGIRFNFSDSRFSCPNPQRVEDGRYKCDISLVLDTPEVINVDVTASVDVGGVTKTTAKQSFTIEAYNNPPVMNPLKCNTIVRVSRYKTGKAPYRYEYRCNLSATDPDGHFITSYSASGLPQNFNIATNANGTGYIYALDSATTTAGNYNVSIVAKDEFNAVSKVPAILPLRIVDFCGDEKKQSPNMEGIGGPPDRQGYEDCDDHDGTPDLFQSNISWQYGCVSSTCSSLRDGWCGDGTSQDGRIGILGASEEVTVNGVKRIYKHYKENYGEKCDDGNHINGDGCNTYDAAGKPSCEWSCGDGTVNDGRLNSFANGVERANYPSLRPTDYYHSLDTATNAADQIEECDDGNNVNGDGCNTFSANCQFACGDGLLSTNKGEECEFGSNSDGSTKNKNCCSSCLWVRNGHTDSPTNPNSGTILSGNQLTVAIPNSRGVKSLVFNANPTIILDSFTQNSGIAIMLISDLSGLGDPLILGNMKKASQSAVTDFYTWGTTNKVNTIMGAFGFGNCPADKYFCYRSDPVNLKDSLSNRDNLISKIESYAGLRDFDGSRSGLDLAVPEAYRLLKAQPQSYMKYIIILSDGCTCSYDTQTVEAANLAKKDGIKIYTISYWLNSRFEKVLCDASSDNGLNRYSGKYSYFSDSSGKAMAGIIDNIIEGILNSIPQNFSIEVKDSSGQSVTSKELTGNTKDFIVDIPDNMTSCDIGGAGCANNNLYIKPSYSGTGNVLIDNIRANILPLCNP